MKVHFMLQKIIPHTFTCRCAWPVAAALLSWGWTNTWAPAVFRLLGYDPVRGVHPQTTSFAAGSPWSPASPSAVHWGRKANLQYYYTRKPYQCDALAWHQTYLKVATPFPPWFSYTSAAAILLWSVNEPHWCLSAWSTCFSAGSPCTPICPSAINCNKNLHFPEIIYMHKRQTWNWREVEAQIKLCIVIASEHWGGGNKDIIAHVPNLCVVTDNVTKVSGLKVQLNAINKQFSHLR